MRRSRRSKASGMRRSSSLRSRCGICSSSHGRRCTPDTSASPQSCSTGPTRSSVFPASTRPNGLFRQGCLALKGANVAEASSLFTRALETNEQAPRPSLRLHTRAYEWRARCHVLRRDLEAAEHDAERAVRAAAEARDELLRAHALLQAGIVAERRGQWNLARCSTEQALDVYRAHDDLL